MINDNNLPAPDLHLSTRIGLADGLRNLRNKQLVDNVDSYNAIRYASLTTEQQQELATYRQALLNVPQQTGWPTTITWPTKPSWM